MARPLLSTKRLVLLGAVLLVAGLGYYYFFAQDATIHKTNLAVGAFNAVQKVTKLLPIEQDTKEEIEAANLLLQKVTANDNVQRSYLVLLQNSFELRPGGGFLGQYAIIRVKNGQIVSHLVEDANLLDQRIQTKVTPPWPLTRIMQIKRWKFRDSNFSPDFPTNAEKAIYFARLGGRTEKFDGVIAVNTALFDNLLKLTGPVSVPGYPVTLTADGGSWKLEEWVEQSFSQYGIPVEQRKDILKKMAPVILNQLVTVDNIPKLAEFAQAELRDKNIMVWFRDPEWQTIASRVHWDGAVAKDWNGDYLMVVDANLGALKTDYFIKRSLEYVVDFTGEKPTGTVNYTYNHTATHGDWRTSDYHTYTRVLAPLGSTFLERVLTGGVQPTEAFGKTMFGYKVDVLIGRTQTTSLKYQLPDSIRPDNYQLLIQKQSGVGTLPVKVVIKTKDGEFTQTGDLQRDLKFEFKTTEEKK